MKKKGLGKGLDAILPESFDAGEDITFIAIDEIRPNPWQPREKIEEDEEFLALVESIKSKGILQPVIVRERQDGYELVAGWRRYEAAKKAGLNRIPSIIKKLSDKEVLEIALIENVQRKKLNPIEEAKAYKTLMEEFGLKQEEIAKIVGKNRSSVSNTLRLLNLTPYVQEKLKKGEISEGHARVLLRIDDPQKQIEMCNFIIEKKLSAREVEKFISAKQPKKTYAQNDEVSEKLSNFLSEKFGSTFKVKFKRQGKVELKIIFNDRKQFEDFLKRFGGENVLDDFDNKSGGF